MSFPGSVFTPKITLGLNPRGLQLSVNSCLRYSHQLTRWKLPPYHSFWTNSSYIAYSSNSWLGAWHDYLQWWTLTCHLQETFSFSMLHLVMVHVTAMEWDESVPLSLFPSCVMWQPTSSLDPHLPHIAGIPSLSLESVFSFSAFSGSVCSKIIHCSSPGQPSPSHRVSGSIFSKPVIWGVQDICICWDFRGTPESGSVS